MAEGDATAYNNFFELLMLGDVHLDTDTLKMILLTSGYSFDRTGNPGYATVSANEVTATGYSAGGETLTGKSVAQNDTANNCKFDAADITWSSLATCSPRHAVLYDGDPTAPVADPLLIRWELTKDANGGDYKLQFNAAGVAVMS